jgi:hypothetical protein
VTARSTLGAALGLALAGMARGANKSRGAEVEAKVRRVVDTGDAPVPVRQMVMERPSTHRTFEQRMSDARKAYMSAKPEGKAAQRRLRQMQRAKE